MACPRCLHSCAHSGERIRRKGGDHLRGGLSSARGAVICGTLTSQRAHHQASITELRHTWGSTELANKCGLGLELGLEVGLGLELEVGQGLGSRQNATFGKEVGLGSGLSSGFRQGTVFRLGLTFK